MNTTTQLLLATTLSVLMTQPALAARPPESGQLLRQTAEPPKPPPPLVDETATDKHKAAQAPAADDVRFRLRVVHFSGNQIYQDAELLALVQDAIGTEVNLTGLNALVQRITNHYRNRGYLVAYAYLPEQEIEAGEVKIAVLEGRLGEIKLQNSARIHQNVLAPLDRIRPGAPINSELLDGALLRLAEVPGLKVTSSLRPGEAVGTSDFLVDVAPGRAWDAALDFDNAGDRYTAAERLGTSLAWNSPAGLGDQLSLRVQSGGDRFNYGRLGYQLPVGPWATRVGAAWSRMDYSLGEDFASLDANGSAEVGSLYLMHPIQRSRRSNWSATLQYDDIHLIDRVDVVSTKVNRHLHSLNAGLIGDFVDGLGGGGSNSLSLIYTGGELRLDSISAGIDALTARSTGHFDKWSASVQRLQRLPANWLLSLGINGQWTSDNLDSSQKLLLGGASGVRAYPQGEASGDSGYVLNLELHHAVGQRWDLFGFYDQGEVQINSNPWGPGKNERHLAGYGLGAGYKGDSFSLRTYLAWAADTGKPTSDRDQRPRIWVYGGYRF